ncbi:MAG: triose-phosphate isomerase [Candidatus Marinimicrobia bacterium]|jgi:triosephosphate isomerase|nr:triose-phosphate isomerase [Candidatus Neomarinimicrobiota bacterium]
MNIKPIVAGNWKMYKTLSEGVSFVGNIRKRILDKEKVKVIFCPPFNSLFSIVETLDGTSFGVGAQNAHHESQGAFTGEISVEMLKSMGVQYVIIGHSERRHIFGESDTWVNRKIHAVLDGELIPIFCIGESLEDRQKNQTMEILHRQIKMGLDGLDFIDPEKIIIAYEPVWAIGTGETATRDQVAEAHESVKSILCEMFDEQSSSVPILYGGSVNEKNATELIQTEGVDGFLIGGASLKEDSFCSIIAQVTTNYKG